MRPFEGLSEQGKIRRLHGAARSALSHYDIEVARLRCVARDTNTTFRVDTLDGRTFALRVGAPRSDTLVDTPTELAWLDSLATEPSIHAAHPHRNRLGEFMTLIDHPGVPHERAYVLFDWLPGTPIGDGADRDDYRLLGEVAARLHDHGERWQRPPGLQPLVWNRVFYYPDEPVVLYRPEYRHLMTPDRVDVVVAVAEMCEAELSRLHREVPVSILHGDLHPWNVIRDRDMLYVFDFEDLMVGAPVQDIAITLFYNRTHDDYAGLRAAFRHGYTTLRPWPVEYEGQLELLMAARTVMFINYVLRLDLAPDEYVPMAVDRVASVL